METESSFLGREQGKCHEEFLGIKISTSSLTLALQPRTLSFARNLSELTEEEINK